MQLRVSVLLSTATLQYSEQNMGAFQPLQFYRIPLYVVFAVELEGSINAQCVCTAAVHTEQSAPLEQNDKVESVVNVTPLRYVAK